MMYLQVNNLLQTTAVAIISVVFGYLGWFWRQVVAWRFKDEGRIVPRIQNTVLLKSATELAKEIREGTLRSEDVIRAYAQRIQEVEPYINATVECPFKDALEEARKVDALVASGKHTKEELAEHKPLLGVPISVKVYLSVKGLLCTSGSSFFRDVRATEDATSVALMKNAGAIVIATTNMSECGLNIESDNLVHGRTRNPYNTSRISGGSSGGEGALLASGGSVLGLGNDLQGSIRIPCHFTGLYGHKPSRGQVPNEGLVPAFRSELSPYLSTGPMCRYAEDLVTSMKVLSPSRELRLSFQKPVDFKKIKICYMVELQDFCATPVENEITNSIKKAVHYFQFHHGSTVQKVSIPNMKNVNLMCLHLLVSTVKDIKSTITAGKGASINEILDLIKFFLGKSTFSFGPLLTMNAAKFPLYNTAHIPYYEGMLQRLKVEFDEVLKEDTVFLFPTYPVTAPYRDEVYTTLPSVGFTGLINFLGFPSTQCPLGFSKEGLPYGMQIIGRQNSDALTIACASELEKVFGGWIPPGNV